MECIIVSISIFDLYSSSLLQTCRIVFFTYLLHSKTPKQVFFNSINIFDIVYHTLLQLFYKIYIFFFILKHQFIFFTDFDMDKYEHRYL